MYTINVQPQNNVVVFVDVSKSGSKILKEKEAKELIQDFVTASLTLNKYPNWKLIDDLSTISDNNFKSILAGSGNALVSNNSIVGMVEIGNYGRHLINKKFDRISPTVTFSNFLSTNYPSNVYRDMATIIDVPLAWLASFLKSQSIPDYYVFIVSDEKSDKGNSGSKVKYTEADKKLIADYGKGNSQPTKVCTFEGINAKEEMCITIWRINLAAISIAPNTNSGIFIPPPISDDQMKISIPPPLGDGTHRNKDNPYKLASNNISISWNCSNCPSTTKFQIKYKLLDENKAFKKEDQISPVTLQNIPSGVYRLDISAPGINSDYCFFEVPSSNKKKLWLGLIPLVVIGIGYYFWNKKRQEKIDKFTANKADDIFTSTTGSNKGQSDTTGYF
jgi:hypothetical protein